MLICDDDLTVVPILDPEKELEGEKAMALAKRAASRRVRKVFIVMGGRNQTGDAKRNGTWGQSISSDLSA
jgi:hypothetical protein